MQVRRILVTGAGGQVGRSLSRAVWPQGLAACFLKRSELDITCPRSVAAALDQHQPDLIINAAAYTDVAKAEREPSEAYRVNAVGPALLAEQARARDCGLIHISTDFVFSGQGPHAEDSIPAPLNLYGASKYAGEQAVLLGHDRSIVVRTAWVFDAYGSNFVTKLLAQRHAEQIQVVDDEIGSPTSADEIAKGLIRLVCQVLTKGVGDRVLHLVNEGEASRYAMAQALIDYQTGRGEIWPELVPVSAAFFASSVRRPQDSRLASTRLTSLLGWTPAPWREALERVLDQRHGEQAP